MWRARPGHLQSPDILELSAEAERQRANAAIVRRQPSDPSAMTQLRRAEMFRIASAIVTAWPRDCGRLVDHIGVLPGTEVRHVENSRIIVVIEGEDERAIRNCLAEIAAMRETLSVNLVFEHFERLGLPGDEP